jgi:hypothetical protein
MDQCVCTQQNDKSGHACVRTNLTNVTNGELWQKFDLFNNAAFIQKLPPVKTGHDVLKDKMLADQVRLQAALDIKPRTHEQVVAQGDELNLTR